jgi:carbamoyltransferase
MAGSLLGPAFPATAIAEWLEARGYPYRRLAEPEWADTLAALIEAGHVVGVLSGRMEFGPRALGARSILGDARSPEMQSKMNLKIKFREGFRPFAPIVLEERASEWFEIDRPSPYMLLVADVRPDRRLPARGDEADLSLIDHVNRPRSSIPAVTHVDYSARLQTVGAAEHPRLHALLSAFERRTGCPVLVNTSFNVRGEPIVCTPEDAYRCFMRTHMDALVLEDCLLLRSDQPPWQEASDWRSRFSLD